MSKGPWQRSQALLTTRGVVCAVLLVCTTLLSTTVLTQVIGLESARTIFNDVWDHANHQLMGSTWAGAATTAETVETILNDVWDHANHRLNMSGSGGGGTEVNVRAITAAAVASITTCTPGQRYDVIDAVDPSTVQQRCTDAGTGLESLYTVSLLPVPTSTAIQVDAQRVLSMRPQVTEISGSQTLGVALVLAVTVGTTGANLTLPDPGDESKPGILKMIISDTGPASLTLTPPGTTLINGSNTSPPSITGRYSGYNCWRLSAVEWYCEELSPGALGTIQLPVNAVKLPTANSPYIDSSENNTRLLFDQTTSQCALWEFVTPLDFAGSYVLHLPYSLVSVTGAFAVGITAAVMKQTPGTNVDFNTDSYDTINTCADALVPSTAGAVNDLACPLATVDGVVAGDMTKVRLCRNVGVASNAAGPMEVVRAYLTYVRQ